MRAEARVPAGAPEGPAESPSSGKRRRNAAVAIRKWLGAGTTKRLINHEEEALMGEGMEEEDVGLVGRAWEVDLKETRPPPGWMWEETSG